MVINNKSQVVRQRDVRMVGSIIIPCYKFSTESALKEF